VVKAIVVRYACGRFDSVLGEKKMEENLFYMASKGITAWCRRDFEYSDCPWLVLAGSEVVPWDREGWMDQATQKWMAILRAKEFLIELKSGLWMFAKDWLCTSRSLACNVCGGYHESGPRTWHRDHYDSYRVHREENLRRENLKFSFPGGIVTVSVFANAKMDATAALNFASESLHKSQAVEPDTVPAHLAS
jgi:hypothetical protein